MKREIEYIIAKIHAIERLEDLLRNKSQKTKKTKKGRSRRGQTKYMALWKDVMEGDHEPRDLGGF